jgi:hypothetical protein
MKLKKFFAGVLAAAMMLTVGATAALAETPAGATADDSVTITKTYKLENDNTASGEDTFTFTIAGQDVKNSAVKEVPRITNPTKTVTLAASKDGATQNFTVRYGDLNITRPGVYYYTITESGSYAGVTGTNSLILKVTAGYEGNSKTLSYWSAVRETENSNKGAGFTNTYKAGSLSVTKNVTGSLGDHESDFYFLVSLSSDKNVTSTVSYAGGRNENGNFTFTKNGEGENATWTASKVLKLHDNETFTISNLPYGVSYDVKELSDSTNVNSTVDGDAKLTVDGTEYTVSYDKVATGALNAASAATTITNSAGTATIDTGVILDNAPYIALLAIVAIGGVALVLNKRRRDEE